jgi:UDP-glucose 4-epimerase
MNNVLITGGAGYIGSSLAYLLLEQNYNVFIVDNFSNSNDNNIVNLPNKEFLTIYNYDCCDKYKLESIFIDNKIDIIVHMAGLKSVSESIHMSNHYYRTNLVITLNLLDLVEKYSIKRFIFSSSATVYGNSPSPLCETSLVGKGITNPYGWSKYMNEQIISDFSNVNKKTEFIILRYFNPVGSMRKGIINENPKNIPNNVMPVIISSYLSNNIVNIFGNDYTTKDGTAMRDYIHIEDLVNGHIKAVQYQMINTNYEVFNLGTGNPYSVLDLIKTFEKINNVKVNYKFDKRRSGDLELVFCNPEKANRLLNWKATRTLEDMCRLYKKD